MSQAISSPDLRPDAALELFGLTSERLELLKRTVAKGCTDDEFALFVEVCKRRKIDPFSKLLYPVKRWDSKLRAEVMAVQSSIDSFRLVAGRNEKYAGQLGPQWCGEDGTWVDVWLKKEAPSAARIGILRHDFKEPLWTVALWNGYVQLTKEGRPTSFWAKMGPLMLAKCAEALGLRRAFPEDLAGLYVAEEMEQATTAPAEPTPLPTLGPTPAERAAFDVALDRKPQPPKAKSLDVLLSPAGNPVTVAGEWTPERIQKGLEAIQKGKDDAAEEVAKRAEVVNLQTGEIVEAVARPAIQVHTWNPADDNELEVAFPVQVGFWLDWCEQPIPRGPLHEACKHKGEPTWRTAAGGKKGGGRHAILLELVLKGAKRDKDAQAMPFHREFERAACTLAMLMAGKESDPTRQSEQGTLY